MRSSILITLTVLLSVCGQDPKTTTATTKPVDVFAELDGSWAGTFVGYDTTGKELYRIRVEQHYETIDANVQKVRITDRLQDGTVITGEGKNRTIRDEHGVLSLHCSVRKSTGETVEHLGHLSKGPMGDQQLVWYSQKDGRSETFREWITGEGANAVYHIQGMGRYGDTLILMAGEYHRIP